mgnify:CR=1 FL=1
MPYFSFSLKQNFLSKDELLSYSVYSGHFDWDFFDFLSAEDTFFFTVLRQPLDRILSFYFFLRQKAQTLSSEQLKEPGFAGMNAALTLSPDDYFADPDLNIRAFIDDHYDNFYMHYFAGRNYQGYSRFKADLVQRKTVLELAQNNIKKMSAIYTINDWDQLQYDFPPKKPNNLNKKYFINRGDGKSVSDRLDALYAIGPADLAVKKIFDFCEYDNVLYEQFKVLK